jgi:hypothetical protein
MNAAKKTGGSKSGGERRRYRGKTIKVLFAMSGNQCAHPDCPAAIVQPPTKASEALIVGQIAHIYAVSDNGPRGKPGLSEEERNSPDNLLLLCPTHHVVVDGQHESYPAPLLFQWKERHERKFREKLGASIGDVGYPEIEVAAAALMNALPEPSAHTLTHVAPEDKIQKNGLGLTTTMLLKMGAAKSAEVAEVLVKAAQLDPSFPDRLRQGLVARYSDLKSNGLSGDDLFMALYDWVGGASGDKLREAAGLCILSHLFIICDAFEK